jgi:urate oxidase
MNDPIVRSQSYGKSQVRLSRVHRSGNRHEFIELTVWIELGGDFEKSYSAADNSLVVATDTMKNTVYILASRNDVNSIESFTQLLGEHFLEKYGHVDRVDVRCEQRPWKRMRFEGKEHDHAFLGISGERRTCHFVAKRGDGSNMRCGVAGLTVLKTTGSGFSHFYRDDNTTLPDTDDRIFATAIEASWPCGDFAANWSAVHKQVREALLDVFANQYSKSVQHTLYEMARAVFTACPEIDEITITMPNQHHLLANLTPFGLQNPNEVFVPTSEPFGNISATISRADANRGR